MHWINLPARQLLDSAALQQQWDRLNAARHDIPFLSASAIGTALQVFGQGSERLLLAKDDAGQALAMLILVPNGRLQWATFQPSQLPLGSWVARAEVSTTAMCRSLLRGPLGLALVISLTQIDPRLAPRESDAAETRHADYIPTAWVEVEGTFEDYWAARGKNLRQNLRKQRNKLAADGVHRTVESMAPALERYSSLESAGWKADQGTAIRIDNDQGHFYRRLFERAASRNESVIYEYLFDDRTVAMNLCLLRGGELIVLKTTYDESIRTLSPAFLLREEEMRSFFEGAEIRRVEYYGRLMDWHTKLTANQRTLYHLTQYRWGWLRNWADRRRATRVAATQVARVSDDEPAPASAQQPA
jgi:CelD/BcsL family acetyltransferase involved in cellulose biosynthesis